jgi:hypothetical protein
MSRLTDSSELQEALSLFQNLFEEQRPVGESLGQIGRNPGKGIETDPAADVTPFKAVIQAPAPPVPVAGEIEGEFRGDRLENVLYAMCRRGGFSGAVVSDSTGLPLAVFNSPVDNERIAAFTSILGDTMAKAGDFLEAYGAEYISMDINYEDKVVVRRFFYTEMEMYLMVLCAQSMDERAEVEMSIEQIVSILG